MKKTCWNYIGRLVSHCLFSKWHKESDLYKISALSKGDLCAEHHVVTVYEVVFRKGTNLAFSKLLVNNNIVSQIVIRKQLFYFALSRDLNVLPPTEVIQIPRVCLAITWCLKEFLVRTTENKNGPKTNLLPVIWHWQRQWLNLLWIKENSIHPQHPHTIW